MLKVFFLHGMVNGFFGDVFADVLFLFCYPFMFLARCFFVGGGEVMLGFLRARQRLSIPGLFACLFASLLLC